MAGIRASWSAQRWQVLLLWFPFFCTENIIHRLAVSWSLHPSPTPLTSRLLCERFSASTISLTVCAVAAFVSLFLFSLFMLFFGTFSPAKLSTVSLELSPVRMTAQCNELCVFSLFSCNFCLCRLLLQPFSSSLECCPLDPPPCHLL